VAGQHLYRQPHSITRGRDKTVRRA
jgi:hypothetical protein